ncbi:WXG100 family type VII secretion target [Amycolatopsis pigmentata]|uniref:WXG100 family type VII secretion target n=1 Tax=Amycolatopsis pigmentata TaxID=450801 RepID=A0ABW5G3P8_9PSEU
MTSFDINHDGLLELNEQLYKAVSELGQMVDDLNMALRNIPDSVHGKVAPLWEEQQRTWNASMEDMRTKLNADTLRSIDVHEIFKEGDYTGTKIFIQ